MTALQACAVTGFALTTFACIAQAASRRARVTVKWSRPSAVISIAFVMVFIAAAAHRLPVASAILMAAAAVNAITDLETGLMFDAVQVIAGVPVIILSLGRYADVATGGALAAAIAAIPYVLSRGRGFGVADVKFAALIGVALGAYGAAEAMYVAYVSGGAAAICLLLRNRADRTSAIAFGPFLSYGAAWALAVGS